MKICLNCQGLFQTPNFECPSCLFEPTVINNYHAFAPELAIANDGFKSHFFSQLVELEKDNFWFKARNALIIWGIKKYFKKAKNILEIGCGTGFVLSGVKKASPHLELNASEIYSAGLTFTAERLAKANLFQMDARKIPFHNEFDIIGAFDVLEHINEDEIVLGEMYRACKHGGGIILTVPQHQFLWSQQDEYACHVRRYSRQDLEAKVQNAGFEIIKSTSFVTLLLPILFVSRILKRRTNETDYDALAEFRIPALLNRLLGYCLSLERILIKAGVNLPCGGSLLLIAKKV